MGLLFLVLPMPNFTEPNEKKAVAFFDGQNLFYHAKAAFGYDYPNYDPQKLFNKICKQKQWKNHGVRFYTGIPDIAKDPKKHAFWSNRTLAMKRSGVLVTTRTLRYSETEIVLDNGEVKKKYVPREKGIDIRIALDVLRMCISGDLDIAVIFSQDQDFAEVAKDVREIANSQHKWLQVCSAFPVSPSATCSRGIDKTDWIKIDRDTYDSCIDEKDYRPRNL